MSEETDIQEDIVAGPGAQLRAARLAVGKTQQEVADALHLRASNIDDLENDIYDNNVSLTFSKGYLRLYAKHLGLPEAELMEAFDSFHSKPKETAKLQSFSKRVAKQANDDRWMLVTYLILALVLVLFLWWWWQQSDDDITTAGALTAPAIPAAATEPLRTQDNEREQDAGDDNALVQDSADDDAALSSEEVQDQPFEQPSADVPQQNTEAVEQSQAEPVISSPVVREAAQDVAVESAATQSDAERVELVFTFSGDCWMNLTDATGEAIAYGIKRSGRVMTVEGVAPFEVILGAPANVSISYDGQAVDMSGFDVTRTARFSLPLQD